MHTTDFSGPRLAWLALSLAFAATACTRLRTAPEPVVTSLLVTNKTSFDVNVFAVASPVAPPIRLGTVVSMSQATFEVRARELQPGRRLALRVHAIGAIGSWTSDAVAVGEDDLAVLDVSANSFGDCSSSMLYVVPKTQPQGGPLGEAPSPFSQWPKATVR